MPHPIQQEDFDAPLVPLPIQQEELDAPLVPLPIQQEELDAPLVPLPIQQGELDMVPLSVRQNVPLQRCHYQNFSSSLPQQQ